MGLAATAATALLLAAAPAKQKAGRIYPPVGDCRDDRHVDRCSPEDQRRVRALFGVRSIEEHRDAGDQVRRAFYVDGYGGEVVAIEFIRLKGADPMLRVHFPAEEDGTRVPPMMAPVDAGRWADMLRRSEHFDRDSPPQPAKGKGGEDEIVLCLHSWVYTVEATDPAGGEARPATTRRRTEDACDQGLTQAFATELAAMALPLLPPCAVLDPKQHRSEATMLASCRLLKGDRVAAAAVRNDANVLVEVGGGWDDTLLGADSAGDTALLAPAFGYKATVNWAGEANKEAEAAAFWVRKIKEANARFYFDEVVGETAERVLLRGMLHRRIGEGDASRSEVAKVEMVWVQEGRSFEIERATVGQFEAMPEG